MERENKIDDRTEKRARNVLIIILFLNVHIKCNLATELSSIEENFLSVLFFMN